MVSLRRILGVSSLLLAAVFGTPAPVQAQALTIGSPNIAIADPLVPRPPTVPCAVTLFSNQQFADFNAKPISYAPPSGCPGPWQKVVLAIDYSIAGTNQYDRTADIWLGGAIIYFGTTEEVSVVGANELSWHIERDLTDYSALFTAAQTGHTDLGNFVGTSGGVTYDGIITGTATLYFYPVVGGLRQGELQPRPDQIVPIGSADLNTTGSNPQTTLSATVTLPQNIERAFLDVYPQGQSGEEFWYSNLPNDLASTYQTTGNTAFREGEVAIDGQPAGIVPIYPWIFTGADGPWMWQPTPGVQTLSFEAYRVDLTPFAGMLDDGNPHTIAVGVYGVTSYFSTAANLLLYLDHGSQQLTGSVTQNTLSLTPNVQVDESNYDTTSGTGSVSVNVNRQYTIAGALQTSHGPVTTQIDATIGFSNVQQLANTATVFTQNVAQNTTIDFTTTRTSGLVPIVVHEQRNYPLIFNSGETVAADGTASYVVAIDQGYAQQVGVGLGPLPAITANRTSRVTTGETLGFDASGNLTAATPADSGQTYTYADPFGVCYNRQIGSQNNLLAFWQDGTNCLAGVNILPWRDRYSQTASDLFGATIKLLP
jgi:hypothetical protein